MSELSIEARALSKHYGHLVAVDELSFEVGAGEVLGFLGPNGAGKSTTMKMLTGFLAPTSGTALVNGHDIVEDSLAARRSMGYLPEGAPLYRAGLSADVRAILAPHFLLTNRRVLAVVNRKRLDELAASDPMVARVHENQKAFRNGVSAWHKISEGAFYKPRSL